MRIKRTVAVIVTATMAMAAFAMSPNAAVAQSGANMAVSFAFDQIAEGLVARVVPSTSDTDSAAVTANADVPFDPTTGVALMNGGKKTVVGLPDAAHLSTGVKTKAGVVVYHNRNGSDAVVVPTVDGAQFLTVIEKRTAPTDYAYPVALSTGGRVVIGNSGNAYILDDKMQPTAIIAAPWARGGGKIVSTYFTTDGTMLTQHVAHAADGTNYPVVADPSYRWYNTGVVITLNKTENGILAASLIFLPVVAGLASIGSIALNNKVMWKAGWFQAQAAWFALHGQCLWIWAPYVGDSDSGGYPCS